MGFFDRLIPKQRRNSSRDDRLDALRDDMLAFHEHLRQGDTGAAEIIGQRLVGQSAELSARVSDLTEHLSLAEFFFDLAIGLRQLNQDRQAEQTYQAALRLSTSACSGNDSDRARRLTAGCYNHLGILNQDEGSLKQSARYYREALAIRESLSKSYPTDEENLVYMGGTLCNLGHVARKQNDLEAALVYYHRSIDILDRSVPECDCGCRDLYANIECHLTGRPSPILTAQLFLRNALEGRAAALDQQTPSQRFRHIRCSQHANSMVASILTERLVAHKNMPSAQDQVLQEVKRELLDAVYSAHGSFILDLQAVKEIDAQGVSLLLHLRSRLVGGGEWPVLSGLSDQLRAGTPGTRWEELFECFATVNAALEDLGDRE